MSAEDFDIVREFLDDNNVEGVRSARVALARIEARLAEVEKHLQDSRRLALGAALDDAQRASQAAEARLVEVEKERDEFAEAMHQASLAVVRRRATTEEKRA